MANEDEYNGWTNRETWAVALHLDNTQLFQTMAASAGLSERPERDLQELVTDLFDECREGVLKPSLMKDVQNMMKDVGSLWRVDWHEVAQHYAPEENS